jgi:predicted ribosome quality control (RQC) complex YloA/Tae2 family protein
MIQFYNEIEKSVKEINKIIEFKTAQIQKIYSTGRYLSLQVRVPGKTIVIYIGRGGAFQGIWISNKEPRSELRIKDKILEYFRSKLTSLILNEISLDDDDRIISLNLKYKNELKRMVLFYKGVELYILFQEDNKIFKAWEGKYEDYYEENIYNAFDSYGRKKIDKSISNSKFQTIEELLKNELDSSEDQTLKNKKNQIIEKINKDLSKLSNWKKIVELVEKSEKSWLEQLPKKALIEGIKFNFENNDFYKRRDIIYQRLKKIKNSEEILKERLDKLISEKNKIVKKVNIIHPPWANKEKKAAQNVELDKNIIKYENEKLFILVGKNTLGNDIIRNKLANKEDYWIHLDGLNSAHLLLRLKGMNLSIVELNIAGSILAKHSDFKSQGIPIIYTQYKNVKGVKGKAGAVFYKKEKHFLCNYVDNWELFFNRSL